jgi:hypothetical protein
MSYSPPNLLTYLRDTVLGRRLSEARSYIERLRIAFDLFEMSLKLIAVYNLAELSLNTPCPEQLANHVKKKIFGKPALGDWLRAILLANSEGGPVNGICDRVRRWSASDNITNLLSEAIKRREMNSHIVLFLQMLCVKKFLEPGGPSFFDC